jgi:hypothetical protein
MSPMSIYIGTVGNWYMFFKDQLSAEVLSWQRNRIPPSPWEIRKRQEP